MSAADILAAPTTTVKKLSGISTGSRRCNLAVVTGATSGIGRECARTLAEHGFSLVLTGRNHKRGSALIRSLNRQNQGQRFTFIEADLASKRDVSALGERLSSDQAAIHLLINNAGARFDRYEENDDGVELTFATNHLGHFQLTGLVLTQLIAGKARVINVASSSHLSARFPVVWPMPKDSFDRRQAYAQSKLANIVFTLELARRLSGTGVTVNAVHPGGVATRFALNNGFVSWMRHITAHAIKRELLTPKKGSRFITQLALSSDDSSGGYYSTGKRVSHSPLADDSDLNRRLWETSLQLSGLEGMAGVDPRFLEI
jgi:NAD(P)-dependent dehydrogenase (short-subunit alcohol dehydrogenase family)